MKQAFIKALGKNDSPFIRQSVQKISGTGTGKSTNWEEKRTKVGKRRLAYIFSDSTDLFRYLSNGGSLDKRKQFLVTGIKNTNPHSYDKEGKHFVAGYIKLNGESVPVIQSKFSDTVFFTLQ